MTKSVRSNTKKKHKGLNSHTSPRRPFPEQNLDGEKQKGGWRLSSDPGLI